MSLDTYLKNAARNTVVLTHKLNFLWSQVQNCPNGDIVEVGVYQGGSSLIISSAAREFKPESKVFLCDTFKGIVLAGVHDNGHRDGDFSNTSKNHVDNLLKSQGLSNYTLLEGIFPYETGHLVDSEKISFLHIDVDVYEGYLAILKWAQSKLVNNAIIVFDDYSAPGCLGAKKAVDEYFADRNDFELNLSSDQHGCSWARYIKD